MCGIAGYLSFTVAACPSILERMLLSIGHRGPDSLSGSVVGRAALGTARLAVVDIEGGVQPALSIDRKVIVVFNGEIFNYLELRKNLKRHDIAKGTNSEVETILDLYLWYGREFVHRIKGQFAIAIWDGRDETLTLFRDRFGIRPLFWHRGQDALLFGSEIKALFASGFVSASLNLDALLQTFRFWTVAGDTSPFAGIFQVPPGHMAICTSESVRLEKYWSWPIPHPEGTLQLDSDEDYFEAFAHEMRAAVDRQRMSDVPVGSYLSGGVDSSVLALLLQEMGDGQRLKTYSVSFGDPEYDESSSQNLMVKYASFDHTAVHIDSEDIGKNFPQVVWQAETSLFRTAPVPLFLLSRKVHEDGRKVVMTGEGADEILLGYDLFREVMIRRFWSRQPNSKWRGHLLQHLYAYLPQFRNSRYLGMIMEFYRPTLVDPGSGHYAMMVRWRNGQALAGYFGGELQERSHAYEPLSTIEPWLPEKYAQSGDIEQAQIIELSTLLANYLLSSQGDRMTMAHGVEGRYPYLDEDFVAFAAQLPRSLKLRTLKDKFVLRNAFRNKLPQEVVNRPKVAYQAPDMRGFFVNGKCPEYVEYLLGRERIKDTGLFNDSWVERLVNKGRQSSNHRLRISMSENMAFVMILSTQLLDEIFVRGNLCLTSDIHTKTRMDLI
ncbi:MAG: asparagine synthase (glutamine-hydrolyzing) [Magnetococcales bacterium]|nr:asparagine synthase (glutamine-hydrolyzing) [Magnetococcales bacterium]